MTKGWIGVDLDGTLAVSPKTYDVPHQIGEPIPKMVARVKAWLADGIEVRIVTARAAGPYTDWMGNDSTREEVLGEVACWLKEVFGRVLPIQAHKDMYMYELWDDRAIQVVRNTGERVDGKGQ